MNSKEFRVWDKTNKCWADIRQILIEQCSLPRMDGYFSFAEIFQHPENNKLVSQQFIGFTDKNGKKVFVGDLLKTKNGIFEITFQNGSFCADGGWGVFPIGWDAKMTDYTDCDIVKSNWIKKTEIVGNILENPELNKKTK